MAVIVGFEDEEAEQNQGPALASEGHSTSFFLSLSLQLWVSIGWEGRSGELGTTALPIYSAWTQGGRLSPGTVKPSTANAHLGRPLYFIFPRLGL